jgi:hypothetical protein
MLCSQAGVLLSLQRHKLRVNSLLPKFAYSVLFVQQFFLPLPLSFCSFKFNRAFCLQCVRSSSVNRQHQNHGASTAPAAAITKAEQLVATNQAWCLCQSAIVMLILTSGFFRRGVGQW